MARVITLQLHPMQALPWPTAAQRDEFVEHLCWAHSWYKHLPLHGAPFVIFLRGDAGAGFEDRDRLHYGWKRTAEYRARYGLLDYAWRQPEDTTWRRDAGVDVEPSPELLEVAGFTLGPPCSNDFNAIDVLCARVDDGEPVDDGLHRLRALHGAAEDAFHALPPDEQGAAFADHPAPNASAGVRAYRARQAAVAAHYASLRAPHVAAIRGAIDRLHAAIASALRP